MIFFGLYESYSALGEYSYIKPLYSSSVVITNLGLEYFSADKSSYYFGVFDYEAIPKRQSYYLDETLNYYISADYVYNMDKRWTFFANLEYKYYDEQIYKSPIVDQRFAVSNFLGVVYVW